MSFNKEARDRLQKFVTVARATVEADFLSQLQSIYGLDPVKGTIADLSVLQHLTATDYETASDLHEIYDHYQAQDKSAEPAAILRKILREQTQTFLIRICALRMAEERGVFMPSLSKGWGSDGFINFKIAVGNGFQTDYETYVAYLNSLFDELAVDVPQVFDRTEPFGLLFMKETPFSKLLSLLNAGDMEVFWKEDETIGWIFQYFNSDADFSTMRGQQNKNPRNSYELAVRNQFFTPRYVVEFLLDNTLGRLWVNETQGHTKLREKCKMLVLKDFEGSPSINSMRDPRSINVLDPACGSMHFGLYAFDLLEAIYEETWDFLQESRSHRLTGVTQEGVCNFRDIGKSKEEFLQIVPALIIQNNLYGVDIDVRATQIASLALWLRAQKSLQQLGVSSANRPRIGRGNVVAAMAPPPEGDIRKAAEKRFGKDATEAMNALDFLGLVPETGMLLPLEKSLDKIISEEQPMGVLFQEFNPVKSWKKKRHMVDKVLTTYANEAGHSFRERLYVRNAQECMRMIDQCNRFYDVIVMNPPFGAPADGSRNALSKLYPESKKEIIGMFVLRMKELLNHGGYVGTISSRTIFFQSSSLSWREIALFSPETTLPVFADLGLNVMDSALVESAAYVIGKTISEKRDSIFIDVTKSEDKACEIEHVCNVVKGNQKVENAYFKNINLFKEVPGKTLKYDAEGFVVEAYKKHKSLGLQYEPKVGTQTSDNNRYVRLIFEIENANKYWVPMCKGGEALSYYADVNTYVNWESNGQEIKDDICAKYPYLKGNYSFVVKNEEAYFRPGLTWTLRANSLALRVFPKDGIFDHGGNCVFVESDEPTDLLATAAILNSRAYQNVMSVQLQMANGNSRYECGMLSDAPVPEIPQEKKVKLAELAKQNFEARRHLDSVNEESHAFVLPELVQVGMADFDREADEKIIKESQATMDTEADALYGFTSKVIPKQEKSRQLYVPDETEKNNRLLMWAVGVAFGRFDIKLAIGDRDIPEFPEPFDPYSKLSIGRLPEGDAPFIQNKGIFVNDPGHPLDLATAVRSVLKECYIGEHLDVDTWIKKDFFKFHLSVYSGSQRTAPIYWPIGTASGSYVLWLYYPGFTDQTLYTALNDFIDPKIKAVNTVCDELRKAQDELDSKGKKQLDEMTKLAAELAVFREAVANLANTFHMHFNDGVVINASQFRTLIQSKDWVSKKLDPVAMALSKGELDWSETAADLYPERVKEVCKKNRSIALAHKDRWPLDTEE